MSDGCESESLYYAATVGSKPSHCSSEFKNLPLSIQRLFLCVLWQDRCSKWSSATPRLFLMENVPPNTIVGSRGLGTIWRWSGKIPAKATLWYEIFVQRQPHNQSQASGKYKTQQWAPLPQKTTQERGRDNRSWLFFISLQVKIS